MSQNITYKVKLLGSDGKEYVESFDNLFKDLNIGGIRDYLLAQIADRRNEIDFIEKHFKQQFLALMRSDFITYLKEWQTKSFRQYDFCKAFNSAKNIPFAFRDLIYELFDEALKSGVIVAKKGGWYQAAVTPQ